MLELPGNSTFPIHLEQKPCLLHYRGEQHIRHELWFCYFLFGVHTRCLLECLKEFVYTWLAQHYVLVIFYIVADLSHSAGVNFLLSLLLLLAVDLPFRKEH